VSASGRGKIRVLLADDHPLVLEGLLATLRGYPRIEVVGAARNGREALSLARRLRPDVVLLDIAMEEMNGVEAARRLRKSFPLIRTIFLTMHLEPGYLREMVHCGAKGYVLKDASPREIVRAVLEVHSGGTFFSPAASNALAGETVRSSGRIEDSRQRLTPRETDVLTLIAEGLSNKEIAVRFGIGVRTVESHRERIMDKLNIRNTAGLTRYAIAKRLIKID
jgi:two-component system, NarL family, nitrate/nitrite response regulator NarL